MNAVTRSEVDQYLGVSVEQGSFIDYLISSVSFRIAQHCGREDFGPEQERTEYKDGGNGLIALNVWPVTSIAAIYDDPLHDWEENSKLDASTYYADENGVVYYENGRFLCGNKSLKVVYTGGYADESAIPTHIKNAVLIQIKSEYLQQQPGRIPAPFEQPQLVGLLPEVIALLVPYRRRLI